MSRKKINIQRIKKPEICRSRRNTNAGYTVYIRKQNHNIYLVRIHLYLDPKKNLIYKKYYDFFYIYTSNML